MQRDGISHWVQVRTLGDLFWAVDQWPSTNEGRSAAGATHIGQANLFPHRVDFLLQHTNPSYSTKALKIPPNHDSGSLFVAALPPSGRQRGGEWMAPFVPGGEREACDLMITFFFIACQSRANQKGGSAQGGLQGGRRGRRRSDVSVPLYCRLTLLPKRHIFWPLNLDFYDYFLLFHSHQPLNSLVLGKSLLTLGLCTTLILRERPGSP